MVVVWCGGGGGGGLICGGEMVSVGSCCWLYRLVVGVAWGQRWWRWWWWWCHASVVGVVPVVMVGTGMVRFSFISVVSAGNDFACD